LREVKGLGGPVILQVYFWDDLAEKHQTIFRRATVDDVALAISSVEKKSEGQFKLLSLNPSVANRDVLRVVLTIEKERPLIDVSNLYWKIQYSEGTGSKNQSSKEGNANVFLLTPRDLSTSIAGQNRSIVFAPNGVQYQLLKYFSKGKGFVATQHIVDEVEAKERTIRTEIGKLRKKVNDKFGLGGKNFIDYSKGEGYRLAEGIKIRE